MTTYYVSNANPVGSDAAAGTSEAAPWLTIAKVNGFATFAAGDSILFNKACTWRETLNVPTGGSVGSRIAFGAYGLGALPIISGSNLATGFTSEAVAGTDLTADANLQSLHYLEEATAATRLDFTANNNDLVDTGSVAQSAIHQQGSFSAQFVAASAQKLEVADASLSAGYVGKTGTTNTAMTALGWFYIDSDTAAGLFGKGTGGTGWALYASSSKFKGTMLLDAAQRIIEADDVFSLDTWYHVVLRLHPTTKKLELFVNGALQAQTYTATSTTIPVNGSPLRVGQMTGIANHDGLTDELCVFNRALTDAEIGSIYQFNVDGAAIASYTIYYKTGFSAPVQVFGARDRLPMVNSKTQLTPGKSYWDSVNSRVYVRLVGDADPATQTVEVSQRNYGINSNVKDNLTVSGLQAEQAAVAGILIGTSDNVTVSGCTVTRNYDDGLDVFASTGTCDNLLITGNTATANGASGFKISNITNSTISLNLASGNSHLYISAAQLYSAGLRFGSLNSADNIVEYNISELNGVGYATSLNGDQGVGIWPDDTGAGNLYQHNICRNNHSHGIFNELTDGNTYFRNIVYGSTGYVFARGLYVGRGSKNTLVYHNAVYGCKIGIMFEGTSPGVPGDFTGNVAKNNVAAGNSLVQFHARYGGENDGTNGSGNVYLNNCFGAPVVNTFIEWGVGVKLDTVAAFDTAYGSATLTVGEDPLYVDAASGNLHLRSNSPALNKGAVIAGINDGTGGSVLYAGSAPDLGAYEEGLPGSGLVTGARIKETAITVGTDILQLDGAVAGFRPFSAITIDGSIVQYAVVHRTLSEWEEGEGRWTDGDRLVRTRVRASSNAGALVNFGAGTKDVFCDFPAEHGLLPMHNRVQTTDIVIPTGASVLVVGRYEVGPGSKLEVGLGAAMEVS